VLQPIHDSRRALLAYVLPFALFMAGLAAVSALKALGVTGFAGLTLDPMYWVYPLQTAACAAALLWFWRSYDFSGGTPAALLLGIVVGLVVLALWVSPQELLHQPHRTEGFDPGVVPSLTPWMLAARFARLVLVVPLVEEIFWRGFLLRYLMREDFTALPFGSCSRVSFAITAGAFALVHQWGDFFPALATGILLNVLAVRTRSLGACVVAHATANLGLGIYICATRQWGFW
jgi:CAAX prenyl protease-like protein